MSCPNLLLSLVAIIFLIACGSAVPASKADQKVLYCYWGSWSVYRWGDGLVETADIDPNVCTHLVYSFAGLDQRTYKIHSLDRWNDLGSDETGGGKDNYRNLIALRRNNPSLKVMLAIGGYNEGSVKYSTMAKVEARRKIFVDSVVEFLQKYGFDGLDLNWEYPASNGGATSDKQNYVLLLQELRAAFDPLKLILTAVAPADITAAKRGYDLPEIMKSVDYLSIVAYDYSVDFTKLDHSSPLFPRLGASQPCVDNTIKYYLANGAEASKVLLSVVLYGRAYKLLDAAKNKLGSPALGPADPGQYTQQPGLLAYFELCYKLTEEEGFVTPVRDDAYKAPYVYNLDEWIAYEDATSLAEKANYANTNSLAGISVWSLENDDLHSLCGNSLVSSLKTSLRK